MPQPTISPYHKAAEAASHTYDNPVHNILRKCTQLDMMEQLSEHNSTIDPDSLVAGYSLRGSNAMMVAGDELPIPRNPRDMDLVALGNPGYDKKHAEPYILGQLHDAAKAIGASVDFFKVQEHPTDSARRWIDGNIVAPVMLGHKPYAMKKHGYVAKTYHAQDLEKILEHPERYLLQPREQDVLVQEAARGKDIPVTMEIDLNMGIPHQTMRPVKPVSHQRLRANDHEYQGIFINAPVAELVGKLQVINQRQKDLTKDQGVALTLVTLFNLFHHRCGGEITGKLVREMREAFLASPDLAGDLRRSIATSDWRGIVGGVPQNRTKPVSEADLDKLQVIYDDAYASHLLHKKLGRDDIKNIVNCALELADAVLLPAKSKQPPAGRSRA